MNAPIDELDSLPEKLRANAAILSRAEKDLVMTLLNLGQHHIFASWDPPGVNDDKKHAVIAQLNHLDHSCGGGLTGYITRARKLLNASRLGENPFEGWTPSVPTGVQLNPVDDAFRQYEEAGLKEIGTCGFVLVAGGLGERLGYSGIKVELPVETVTGTSYLEHYCHQILAIQSRYGAPGHKLPLAIMVSDDTLAGTQSLLERGNYFGLERDQVTLLKQEKVPALMSNLAHIAMSSPYEVDAKPHGHGDVHYLMHTSGTARRWSGDGVKWVVFFQDTNGLSFVSLAAMLGVSLSLGLDVNSMTVPRIAKQAVGAITRLTHRDGREMTVNVEYNQLDPLLRAFPQNYPDGDSNDAQTNGHSPFPGNINQLLFALSPYNDVLTETKGLMPEFVNPKYKDPNRTVFKKPTRLECMMQDYPRLLPGASSSRVGFTMAPAWLCYSPCKNNSTDAALSIAQGVPAGAPFTAESDQLALVPRLLRALAKAKNTPIGSLEEGPSQTILGVTAVLSPPRVIVRPCCALFPTELERVFPSLDKVSLSSRSTLVLEGPVTVDALTLDGSLAVSCLEVRKRIVVQVEREDELTNDGHTVKLIETDPAAAAAAAAQGVAVTRSERETDRMRGYVIEETQCRRVDVRDAGDAQVPESEGERVYVFNGKILVDKRTLDEERERLATLGNAVPPAGGSSGWFCCYNNVDCF